MSCHVISYHIMSQILLQISSYLIPISSISIDVTYASHQAMYKDDIPSSRILLIERGTVNVFSSEDLSLLSSYEIDRKLGTYVLVELLFQIVLEVVLPMTAPALTPNPLNPIILLPVFLLLQASFDQPPPPNFKPLPQLPLLPDPPLPRLISALQVRHHPNACVILMLCLYLNSHAHTLLYIYVCIHAYMYAHAYPHTQTHIHAYRHTHTHTHTLTHSCTKFDAIAFSTEFYPISTTVPHLYLYTLSYVCLYP